MKRSLVACLITGLCLSLGSCEKDNLDGPDATFSGELRDKKTGELIPQEVSDGSRVYFIEMGWGDNPPVQNMVIKSDGTFHNSMIFSGDYKIIMNRGNYVPLDTLDYTIKRGNNFHVFEVNPYLRILEPELSLIDGKVVARFGLEQITANNVSQIALFADSHIDVSNQLHVVKKTQNLNRQITDGEMFELSINTADYSSLLIPGKSYYFRIGALSHGNETKYNYSASVRIDIP